MDKFSKKMSTGMKQPMPSSIPQTAVVDNKQILNGISKWVPLICAGSAIGISIFVLKELKNTRKEFMLSKKNNGGSNDNDELKKKMDYMEEQIKNLSELIKMNNHQQNINNKVRFKEPIVKNVVPTPPPSEINIINDEEEYEEVEVTDDETDE